MLIMIKEAPLSIQDNRFYGRRVGRNATTYRTSLAHMLPPWALSLEQLQATTNLAALFDNSCRTFWMEIGFGNGEHMLELARRHPEVGVIGVEPFVNGLVHCLKEIEETPPIYTGHLRLIPEDVRSFLPLFPCASFAKICILFSDPWPKKRHAKRRLINSSFLETLSRLLQVGGELILAHDHLPYVAEILELLEAQQTLVWKAGVRSLEMKEWPSWPDDWPMTRYGAKALKEGRPLAFFVWEKQSSLTRKACEMVSTIPTSISE